MPDIRPVALGRAARRSPVTRRARRLIGLRTNSFAISGLAAIAAAAFSGATFVSSGQDGASMAMAILTGVALLCYLANLLMVSPLATGAVPPLARISQEE